LGRRFARRTGEDCGTADRHPYEWYLNEFCRVGLSQAVYDTLDALQAGPHQGRWCDGKTPRQTFLDSLALAKENQIA